MRSRDRDPSDRGNKKPSGRGSYKPHFHAYSVWNLVVDWSLYPVPDLSRDNDLTLDLIGEITVSTLGAVKTGLGAPSNNKLPMRQWVVLTSREHLRAQFEYALDTGFIEILELKPVQEDALLPFGGAADWMRQIFNLLTRASILRILS